MAQLLLIVLVSLSTALVALLWRALRRARDAEHRLSIAMKRLSTALHDALTGLPNEALFRDRVRGAIKRREKPKVHERRTNGNGNGNVDIGHTMFYIDLDGFKAINSACGHAGGDAFLKAIARAMLSCVRSGDIMCRLHGDEFAIFAEFDLSANPKRARILAEAFARRLLAKIQSVTYEGHKASASIGIAHLGDGQDFDSLLADADAAMYRAKNAGKNRYMW